jgi:hypothetical protein
MREEHRNKHELDTPSDKQHIEKITEPVNAYLIDSEFGHKSFVIRLKSPRDK